MKKGIIISIVIIVLIILVAVTKPFYILEEGNQAVILRFGKVIGSQTKAGFHLKAPVVDEVKLFSKKIITWNSKTMEMPTSGGKYITVDTTARWRISDVEQFYAVVKGMSGAFEKLDSIIENKIKNIIAENQLVEAVRDTNNLLDFPTGLEKEVFEKLIINQLDNQEQTFVYSLYSLDENNQYSLNSDLTLSEEKQYWDIITKIQFKDPTTVETNLAFSNTQEDEIVNLDLQSVEDADTSSNNLQAVEKGRLSLSKEILNKTTPQLVQLDASNNPIYLAGIEVIDIVIRQIRYSEDLKNKVFQRMITERARLAAAYRSEGSGQKFGLQGQRDLLVKTTLSEANAKAEGIKGLADAKATTIYSKAYEGSEEFYTFWRSLESYKSTLSNFNKTITTDMQYFDFLYGK